MLDYHLEEFDHLAPLIIRELETGGSVSLTFLRSVGRSRVSLAKAHEAVALMRRQAPEELLKAQSARFISDADARVARSLQKGELGRLVKKDLPPDQILPYVMKTAFGRGITPAFVNQAFHPKSLSALLNAEVIRAYPVLSACGSVCLENGEKISTAMKAVIHTAKYAICAEARRRFPAQRIEALLRENPSLARLRRQAGAAYAREQKLRSALLSAIPEHYRDLYPLARQMRRRFILHLGPTNSGKTYEGVQRLRGAMNGIYLGPLRLLAAEQFETLNLDNVPCSLVTGEEQIRVPGSRVQSSTVEMADLKAHYDVAVIDECQMIADRDRGGAWTAAILGLCADEIHACASPDAEALLTRMVLECGDELSIVRHERMTPLAVEKEGFQFPGSVRPGDA
ncbi:MAG: hypothetical protein IJ048_14350, partial [Clostridia bacterium]|nr:hypothetical protein [Clostridia bacterium]